MVRKSNPSNPNRRAASKSLLKRQPSDEEIAQLAIDFNGQPDIIVAIRGTSHLQHMLKTYIKSKFRELEPEDERYLFDGASNGIISGFSSQLRIAFAIKLIELDQYNDLMLMNTIRNVFAHTQHPVTFETTAIQDDCLKLAMKNQTEKMRETYTISSGKKPPISLPRAIFINSIFFHYHFIDVAIKGLQITSPDEFAQYINNLTRAPYNVQGKN